MKKSKLRNVTFVALGIFATRDIFRGRKIPILCFYILLEVAGPDQSIRFFFSHLFVVLIMFFLEVLKFSLAGRRETYGKEYGVT